MAKETEKKPASVSREELCEVRNIALTVHKSYSARRTVIDKLDVLIARYPEPKVKKSDVASPKSEAEETGAETGEAGE